MNDSMYRLNVCYLIAALGRVNRFVGHLVPLLALNREHNAALILGTLISIRFTLGIMWDPDITAHPLPLLPRSSPNKHQDGGHFPSKQRRSLDSSSTLTMSPLEFQGKAPP